MDAVLGCRNDHAGHQERDDERHDRYEDPARALLDCEPCRECPGLRAL
jgi:hypothetical protein